MKALKWIALPALLLLAFAPPALAKKDKSSGSFTVGCLTEAETLQGWEGLDPGEAAAMVTISPANLWPPNHKLTDVVLSLSLSADSTDPVDVSLTVNDITHDQVAGDNEGGHGCGAPTVKQGFDWAPTDFSSLTADATLQLVSDSPILLNGVQLRRERCAKDGTRLYAISVTCCDHTNDVCDTEPVILNVAVPKSKGKGP